MIFSCVIVPDPTLHQNEVDLSYQAFRILFKYRIIYYLMKMEDVPLAQAYYRWKNAYVFDEYVYNVMEYIIAAERPRIFLNRNPTLNLYSMLLLRIRHVDKDPYRTTLSVPLYILPGLNADFDGDILNMIALFEDEMIHMFRKFDPIERYLMCRDDDGLNPYFSITKGQLIDLYHFATFEEEPGLEEPDYEKLEKIIAAERAKDPNGGKEPESNETPWGDVY